MTPIFFVAPLVLLALVSGFAGDSGADESEIGIAEAVILQLVLAAYFGISAFAVAASPGDGPGAALRRLGFQPTTWRALKTPAKAGGLYLVFAIAFGLLLEVLDLSAEQEDVTRSFGSDEGTWGLVLAGVIIVGIAPVIEEVFFRGFLFGGLRRNLGFWSAAVISGLIFGSIHYTGGDSAGILPQLTALGIALAWVYEKTRSLWQAIVLHGVNNALAFTVLVADGRISL